MQPPAPPDFSAFCPEDTLRNTGGSRGGNSSTRVVEAIHFVKGMYNRSYVQQLSPLLLSGSLLFDSGGQYEHRVEPDDILSPWVSSSLRCDWHSTR